VSESAAPSAVLCIYGVPPTMPLKDAAGRSTGQTFTLTHANKASFERALRYALAAFVGGDAGMMGARFVFVRDISQISAAVRSGAYTQLVYYGHADQNTNALIPAPGVRITPGQLASALAGTKIAHVDILGCRSVSFAAELATLAPKLRSGYLTAKRFDNIEINLQTMQVVGISIDRQLLLHFGPK
jgi:hypothetical protein